MYVPKINDEETEESIKNGYTVFCDFHIGTIKESYNPASGFIDVIFISKQAFMLRIDLHLNTLAAYNNNDK